MARLSDEALRDVARTLPDWRVEGDALRREIQFKTFKRAMAFVNQVADLATAARHHPEICIDYNRVRLSLTTHDEGGLTEKDVDLARRIDEAMAQGVGPLG
ncbi:MAG: 4a-hydroxytetrahydrobiopterin dehydratase [Thermomicrobiaceae bacterium]|nr:4a-hydroxytetrahydrobiopterin dehydratase [Thermomicrobiaceae bacterium]